MNITILIVTLLLSTLSHYTIQRVFIRFKKFDDFNHRSSHKTLATRTGGIGIFFSLLMISLYYYFQGIEIFDYSLFIPLGIMFIVGVYDDFYKADFKLKFFLQIIVGKILIDQGFIISNYYGFFGIYEINRFLAQLTTVFVFLLIVNSINFIDGIDGLAITEVIKIFFVIEFFSLTKTPIFDLGFISVCAMVPLYYYNYRKKRKIFLGDSGSLVLGTLVSIYVLGTLSSDFKFSENFEVNKFIFSVSILFYPLMDLLRVIIIRLKNGNSPFVADRNHLHHKLNDLLNDNHFLTVIITQLIFLVIFFSLITISS